MKDIKVGDVVQLLLIKDTAVVTEVLDFGYKISNDTLVDFLVSKYEVQKRK